jgi:hypothetical protein
MEITEITVSYGLTQSLPEYSNVKPLVTLKAVIGEGEDVADVRRQLFEQARLYVEEEVDLALEANDRPARYSNEPRYQVIATRQSRSYGDRDWTPLENVVAIIPAGLPLPEGNDWHHAQRSYSSEGVRYQHAVRVARHELERRTGARFISCADGDLSQLPQRPPAPAEEPEPSDEPEHEGEERDDDL